MLPSQVFHCHFNSNFFPLFLEHLLSDQISVSTGSFLLGEFQVGLEGVAKLHRTWPKPGFALPKLHLGRGVLTCRTVGCKIHTCTHPTCFPGTSELSFLGTEVAQSLFC